MEIVTEEQACNSLNDLLEEIDAGQSEVYDLLIACIDGRIYGASYFYPLYGDPIPKPSGCVLGHLVLSRDVTVYSQWLESSNGSFKIKKILFPERMGAMETRDIERYIWNVTTGDTPETSPIVANLKKWCEEWLTERGYMPKASE